MIFNHLGNPDILMEGQYSFHNANWLTFGCARFMIRYLKYIFANNIFPCISAIIYSISITFVSILLFKAFEFKNKVYLYFINALLLLTPSVIGQFQYLHVAEVFSISFLFQIVGTYILICKKKSLINILASIIFLAISLGFYQSYISVSCVLVSMFFIKGLIDKKKILTLFKNFIVNNVVICLSCIVYMSLLKIELLLRSNDVSSRAQTFSIYSIISNLVNSVIQSYLDVFKYFNDSMLKRSYLYVLVFICILVCLINIIIKFKSNHKFISIILLCIFIVCIPIFINVIKIIMPLEEVRNIMKHQYALILIFGLYLTTISKIKYLEYFMCFLLTVIMFTYLISANATSNCYKISSNYINNKMQMLVSDILKHDSYNQNQTPVIIYGFFDDSILRENINTYKYAIDLPEDVIFWKDENGALENRYYYFLNNFGLDFKHIDYETYYSIITSEQFLDMDTWPNKNSIKLINDYLVIKLEN